MMQRMSSYTRRSGFPTKLPARKTRLCFSCGVSGVEDVAQDERVYFRCKQCKAKSERYIAWDPNMVQYFNERQELVHGSVGVVVQNVAGDVLLFKRVKFPFLWTIPAGHITVGEDPHVAALRELREETGIRASRASLIFAGDIRGDSCVGGADIHAWRLYHLVLQKMRRPKIEAHEGREWQWCALDNLPDDLTYPVSFLFSHRAVRDALR